MPQIVDNGICIIPKLNFALCRYLAYTFAWIIATWTVKFNDAISQSTVKQILWPNISGCNYFLIHRPS